MIHVMDTCGNTRKNELCLVQTTQIILGDISNQKTLQVYVASCSPISIVSCVSGAMMVACSAVLPRLWGLTVNVK